MVNALFPYIKLGPRRSTKYETDASACMVWQSRYPAGKLAEMAHEPKRPPYI